MVVQAMRRLLDMNEADSPIRGADHAEGDGALGRGAALQVDEAEFQVAEVAQVGVGLVRERLHLEGIGYRDVLVAIRVPIALGEEFHGDRGWKDDVVVGEEGVVVCGEGD
jgi:hypothetical protein